MAVMNLAEAAKFFNDAADTAADDLNETLQKMLDVVKDESQRVIGTYDYGWPPLAPATVADRIRQGFTPDDPLLRTGELRASIETVIIQEATRSNPVAIGQVGSDDPVAGYMEFGTSSVPPRSFLAAAAAHKIDELSDLAGNRLAAIWRTGRPAP